MALLGIKVIETLGLAPGPLCGTILCDFGASVTVVQKVGQVAYADGLTNGKKSISINLKCPEGIEIFKGLCNKSDVLIDTYRPGVMEKLGLGPETILKNNPRLVYSRLTGYGQDGFYKHKGGHDINYIGMSGILSLFRKNNGPPTPPVNVLGDFAGGSVLCAMGIILALFERTRSGKGQVIDASITEGVAYLSTWIFKNQNILWTMEPGKNLLDGGYASYDNYKTKDGRFMAVGAIEPQFYSNLLIGLNLSPEIYSSTDTELCKKKFEDIFLTKTQAEWCEIFENLDACVTPVLDINSVDKHKCHVSRQSFFRNDNDVVVPKPAPKLSRTPGKSSNKLKAPGPGQHTIEIMHELGYNNSEIKKLLGNGTICAGLKSSL